MVKAWRVDGWASWNGNRSGMNSGTALFPQPLSSVYRRAPSCFHSKTDFYGAFIWEQMCKQLSLRNNRDERQLGVLPMPPLGPGKSESSVDSWCFAPIQELASLFPSDEGCHSVLPE